MRFIDRRQGVMNRKKRQLLKLGAAPRLPFHYCSRFLCYKVALPIGAIWGVHFYNSLFLP